MNPATLLLVDNGSIRADAALSLRRVAQALSRQLGQTVYPVSLQHVDKIPARELDGEAALTLADFLRRQLTAGRRDFILLPLFFGNSHALTRFVPECAESLHREFGDFSLRLAEPLCPLPQGEPRLADILCDHVKQAAGGVPEGTVVLVDHGSPVPEVSAVRQCLAEQLQVCLGAEVTLRQAVMERRPGSEYDFNGPLLQTLLRQLAERNPHQTVILAMLFFAPGRHAGPEGDMAAIAHEVELRHPGFRVIASPLVGAHEGIVAILADRLAACVAASP